MPLSVPALSPEQYALADHSSRRGMLLSAQWSLASFAAAFLAARLYVKISFKKGLWWDDWLLIASLVMCFLVCIITTILIEEFGMGNHSYDVNIYDPTKWILLLDSRATTTLTALAWTKTAFAVSLLRLTTGKTKAFAWFLIVTLNVALGFSAMVPWIQCRPVTKRWHPDLEGECWPLTVGINIWIGTGALSSLSDFVLAVLPWTFLYSLTLRKKEKVGICVAMSMGAVAGAVGIIKCVKLPSLGSDDDYNEADLFVWDIAEATVTLMAACIPTLRVFLREKTTGPSDERSTRFSQFSFSFRTANRRRMFDTQDIEVIREHSVDKGEIYKESGASKDGSAAWSAAWSAAGSAAGSTAVNAAGSGRPVVVEKAA